MWVLKYSTLEFQTNTFVNMNWQEETKTSWNAFKSPPQYLPILVNDTTQIYNHYLKKLQMHQECNSEVPLFIDELLWNLAQKLHLSGNQATSIILSPILCRIKTPAPFQQASQWSFQIIPQDFKC